MHTKALKKERLPEYEKFFRTNCVVVSSPFIMNRAGDVLSNYTGINIKQKLPLRLYVGVSPTNTKSCKLDQITYRDTYENKFLTSDLLHYAPYFLDVEQMLTKKYKHIVDKVWGIKISIFSELSKSVGLGFNTILSMNLVAALKIMEGKIEKDQFKKMNDFAINEVLNNPVFAANTILQESMELDQIITGGSSFSTKAASLFASSYPIVGFKEDHFQLKQDEKDTLKYFGFRLNELWKELDDIPHLPFDIWVLYSWTPVAIEQLNKDEESYTQRFSDCKDRLNEMFVKTCSQQAPIKKPRFYKYFLQQSEDPITKVYWEIMGAASLEILDAMSKVYQKQHDGATQTSFINALNKMRHANFLTRISSNLFLSFINEFTSQLGSQNTCIAKFPNDTSIMWGALVFVAPAESTRQMLMHAINTMQRAHTWVRLLYANWSDGIETNWLVLEQDLYALQFSEHISKGSIVLNTHQGGKVFGTHEDLVTDTEHDLILDMVHGKIFVQGKKLTSQELCSQNATAEVLRYLMSKSNCNVSNKVLALSSYSKNKNEMFSKIILPLKKLIKERLNKYLPLDCSWSLGEFFIRLWKHDLKIGILEMV